MKKSKKINEDLEKENKEIKENLTSITNNLKTLKDQHFKLQSRSMRDNLIFTGIDEQREESADMCEQLLNKFIEEKLGITDEIPFHRVHRMGRKQTNKSRPIVAKFVNFKDRERIRKTSITALRDQNDRKYSVFEQYPKEINDQRKLLYPHYKAAKRQGKRAQLVMDKLYIEGELFVLTDERQENPNYVPHKIDPRLSARSREFHPSIRRGSASTR